MERFNLVASLNKFYKEKNALSTFQVCNEKENKLFPHQYQALNFIYKNLFKNLGCVLDHDANMGKTVTISVFLNDVLQNSKRNKALIICSPDLVHHWKDHLTLWSQLRIATCTEEDGNKFNDCDVLIVNNKVLQSVPYQIWPFIIFDEADSLTHCRGIRMYRQELESIKLALTNIRAQKPSNSFKFWNLLSFVTTPAFNRESFISQCKLKTEQILDEFNISYYQRLSWFSYLKYKSKFQLFAKKKLKRINNSPKKSPNKKKTAKSKDISHKTLSPKKIFLDFGEKYFLRNETNCLMTPNYYKYQKYFKENMLKKETTLSIEDSLVEQEKHLKEIECKPNTSGFSNIQVESEINLKMSPKIDEWSNIFENLITLKQSGTEIKIEKLKDETDQITNNKTEEKNELDDWTHRFERLIGKNN